MPRRGVRGGAALPVAVRDAAAGGTAGGAGVGAGAGAGAGGGVNAAAGCRQRHRLRRREQVKHGRPRHQEFPEAAGAFDCQKQGLQRWIAAEPPAQRDAERYAERLTKFIAPLELVAAMRNSVEV